jgi:hypothetical protein
MKETAMSTDKKTETPKQQPKTKAPDSLTKTSKKGDIELTDEELNRPSGGTGQRMHKPF